MKNRSPDERLDERADRPEQAANLKARAELTSAIIARVSSWNLSQGAAASRLGINRCRLNYLFRGKKAKFSLDALVNLATASGLIVHIEVIEED